MLKPNMSEECKTTGAQPVVSTEAGNGNGSNSTPIIAPPNRVVNTPTPEIKPRQAPQTKIVDESADRKYFVLTPQLVWAKSQDPYDFTLWNVIKMVAGELGECFLSTEQLATLAMMSAGKVSKCRQRLIKQGLLTGELRQDPGYPQPVWHLRIPDLWKANTEWRETHDALRDRMAFKTAQKSLHLVKAVPKIKEPSPGEERPTPGEEGVSPGETKKNQVENPKKKNSLSSAEKGQSSSLNCLLTTTPQRRLLKDKFVATVSNPLGRKHPTAFSNLAIAEKFDEAAARLNGYLGHAIDDALGLAGIDNLIGIVNYLAKYTPRRREDDGGLDSTSRQLSAALRARSRGDGVIFKDPYTGQFVKRQANGAIVPVQEVAAATGLGEWPADTLSDEQRAVLAKFGPKEYKVAKLEDFDDYDPVTKRLKPKVDGDDVDLSRFAIPPEIRAEEEARLNGRSRKHGR